MKRSSSTAMLIVTTRGSVYPLLAFFGVFLLGAVHATPIRAQDAYAPLEVAADVVLHVEGMACQMCARSMRQSIRKIEGVSDVEVLLDEQKVHVVLKGGHAPSEKTFGGCRHASRFHI